MTNPSAFPFRWLAAAAAMVAALGALPAAAQNASVHLHPQEVGVGESARLEIRVHGESTEPRIHAPDSVSVASMGTAQQIAITNGAIQRSTTYSYHVTPRRTGDHRLGAVVVQTEAGTERIPVPTLKAVRGRTGASAAAPSPFGSASPFGGFGSAFGGPSAAPEPVDPETIPGLPSTKGPRAFMRLELEENEAYVGQKVPGRVRLYVDAYTAGAVEGAPELKALEDEGLLVEGLDGKASQTRRTIDGRLYNQLTWDVAVSAIREGDYTLAAKAPVALEWEDLEPRRSARRDPFDDPFFGSALGSSGFPSVASLLGSMGSSLSIQRTPRSRRTTLETPEASLSVKPLPSEGRPEGFEGAMGSFALEASVDGVAPRVGEPITLRLAVRGDGDLANAMPRVGPTPGDWRVYDPEPVESTDDGHVFEQHIVPLRAGALTLPTATLPHFDPSEGTYAVARTEPVTVEVAPAPEAEEAAEAGEERDDFGLHPDRGEPGTTVASLTTPVGSPKGWLAFALGWLLVLPVGFVAWRRVRGTAAERPSRRERARRIRRARRAMREAAQRGDGAATVEHAHRALAETLAAPRGLEPQAFTLADLPEDDPALTGPQGPTLREVFARADALRFGSPSALADPTALAAEVERALRNLPEPPTH